MQLIKKRNEYQLIDEEEVIESFSTLSIVKDFLNEDANSKKYKKFKSYCEEHSIDLKSSISTLKKDLNKKLDPKSRWDNLLAAGILFTHKLIYIDPSDCWFEYNSDIGVYQPITKTSVQRLVKDYIDNHEIEGSVDIGYKTLKIRSEFTESLNNYPDFVNIKNGILNRKTLVLQPHSSDYKFTYRMEVGFIEPEETPTWDTYLRETPDNPEFILNFLNCLFLGRRENEFMLWLVGKPNSGKSPLISLLQSIFGKAGLTATSMSTLGSSFGVQNLVESYFNIDADINESSFGSATVSIWKKLLDARNNVDVNRKHGKQTTETWPGFLMGASNNLAEFPNNTDIGAVMKRVAFVKFSKQFPNNPEFITDLLGEVDSIFSKIIMMPFKLLKRDIQKWIKDNLEFYYHESDKVTEMILGHYQILKTGEVMSHPPYGEECQDVYAYILKTAKENSFQLSDYNYAQIIQSKLLAFGITKKKEKVGEETIDIFYGLRPKGCVM